MPSILSWFWSSPEPHFFFFFFPRLFSKQQHQDRPLQSNFSQQYYEPVVTRAATNAVTNRPTVASVAVSCIAEARSMKFHQSGCN